MTEENINPSSQRRALILGIESSCDETAAAVLDMPAGRVLSSVIASQTDIHALYGGVVPEIASRAHVEAISNVTYGALREAGVTLRDLDAVAVTAHPGLIGALLVGVGFAKSLAFANNLPLVAVDHIRAHAAASYLTPERPEPPFVALVVSGGHTTLFDATSRTEYALLGRSRDDSAGEAFDKVGRLLGLPYPCGAAMDALAAEGKRLNAAARDADGATAVPSGTASPEAVEKTSVKIASPSTIPHFHSSAIDDDSLDFSFSGLKTAAVNYLNTLSQRGEAPDKPRFAAAFTDAVVDGLVRRLADALDRTGRRTAVLAGGVAANSHLRAAAKAICDARGVALCMVEPRYCGDNAAMIAAQGYFELVAGNTAGWSLNARAD